MALASVSVRGLPLALSLECIRETQSCSSFTISRPSKFCRITFLAGASASAYGLSDVELRDLHSPAAYRKIRSLSIVSRQSSNSFSISWLNDKRSTVAAVSAFPRLSRVHDEGTQLDFGEFYAPRRQIASSAALSPQMPCSGHDHYWSRSVR